MESFVLHTGFAAPLDRANVDTDQIIPKQYLKSIKRTGFGDYLFDAWRFLDPGEIGMTPNERKINRDFVLNEPSIKELRSYWPETILLVVHRGNTRFGRYKNMGLRW